MSVPELRCAALVILFVRRGILRSSNMTCPGSKKGRWEKKRPDVLLAEKAGTLLSRQPDRTTGDEDVDMSDAEEEAKKWVKI